MNERERELREAARWMRRHHPVRWYGTMLWAAPFLAGVWVYNKIRGRI